MCMQPASKAASSCAHGLPLKYPAVPLACRISQMRNQLPHLVSRLTRERLVSAASTASRLLPSQTALRLLRRFFGEHPQVVRSTPKVRNKGGMGRQASKALPAPRCARALSLRC